MGAEAFCKGTLKGRSAMGRARLETDTLEFRSEAFELTIPFTSIASATAKDGALRVSSSAGVLLLDLGTATQKWMEKIRHPRSRLDKIGVKPAWRVSVLGSVDADFLAELKDAVKQVSPRLLRRS